ncbi:MAG: OmpA family protein [Sulfurimonas sp.]|nr:OmpA family protein [Sulfurimonas sp.]
MFAKFLFTLFFIPLLVISAEVDKKDFFMQGDFSEIIRFDRLSYKNGSIEEDASQALQSIVSKIKMHQSAKEEIFVSIIGHAAPQKNDDRNSALEQSKNFAEDVEDTMHAQGVDANLTFLSYQADDAPLFSDETSSSRALSNRVMVTLYVSQNKDIDGDGVSNAQDRCPKTPLGTKVGSDGCTIHTIVMLTDHYKEHNAIVVATKRNETIVAAPKDYVLLESAQTPVEVLSNMPEAEIKALFGEVISNPNQKATRFTLYFDALKLSKESEDLVLPKVIEAIQKSKNAFVSVIGHTDTIGSDSFNEKRGEERAAVIARKIKESGAKYLYLSAESYGEYNLAIKTQDEEKQVLNRRVEILIR